jgi:hypothetical protein
MPEVNPLTGVRMQPPDESGRYSTRAFLAAEAEAEAGFPGKWCRRCHVVKPHERYSTRRGKLHNHCRDCVNANAREARRHRAGMGLDTQH